MTDPTGANNLARAMHALFGARYAPFNRRF